MIAAAFIAGAFVASPELRAYAANTVGSSDIINESILSVDIKNGEVKASEIATDAVGAAEIQGVTKLLFGECKTDDSEGNTVVPPAFPLPVECSINGVDPNDNALASLRAGGNNCFDVSMTEAKTNRVIVHLRNECGTSQSIGSDREISIVVYDK
jgi:hypothetical protein